MTAATVLARELADPIRLTALQLLAVEGPHTMSQLANALQVSAPRLGNHLARLRAADLVTVQQQGRHAVYRLARRLDDVLTALARYGHATASARHPARRSSTVDTAQTCYDHLAGRLGVAVFATLVDRGALRPPTGHDSELALGPHPEPFAELGVDLDTVAATRRKLATACLDRSFRLPHLGGLLGAAVLDAFLADRLVRQREGTRALTLTARGARQLGPLLATV